METIKPILNGTQLNDTTIKWFWDNAKKAAYIIDESDEIIEQISYGINYFIESNLINGETYKRKLILFDADSISTPSDIYAVTLTEGDINIVGEEYVEEKRNEDIEMTHLLSEPSRMSAFKSGVGDKHDLKISKPDDTTYKKNFNLINKIYGIRATKAIKHNTIKFSYRFKLKATEEYATFDSSYNIQVTAQKVSNLNTFPNYEVDTEKIVSDLITVRLRDTVFVSDFSMISFLNNLIRDYSQRYKFKIEITDVVGGIKLYSQTYGEKFIQEGENFTFEDYGYYDHKINIVGYQKIKERDYIEYYPPLKYEPLVGSVNGDFVASESGIKDMITYAPVFSTSDSIKNKKYYCVIEEITPKAGTILYDFKEGTNDELFTLKNGDMITFHSNSILEDESEEKYLIGQVEYGEITVEDNRKYTFTYKIDSVNVEEDDYKRFELEVTPSTSDIIILEYTKNLKVENNLINSEVTISLRAIQNAIAKWSPTIHNGYYYLNQDEHYLYSKCICNGEDRILDNVYLKENINILTVINTTKTTGPIEKMEIAKTSIKDLLINEVFFMFLNNRIYAKPIKEVSDNDGVYFYEFDDVYTYISMPFIFDKELTSLDEILYTAIENLDNKVDVYISPFNKIIGAWDKETKVTLGEIPDIKTSNIYRLIIKMYPAKKPNLEEKCIMINSEYEFKSFKNKFASHSMYENEEFLSNHSSNLKSTFVSKYYDLGYSNDSVNGREIDISITSFGSYKLFIECSDTIDENISKHKGFVEYSGAVIKAKRFFRIKLELDKNTVISQIKLNVKRYSYSNMNIDTYIPSFGNLILKGTYDPEKIKETFTDLISFSLPYSQKNNKIIDDVDAYINNLSNALNFPINEVESYEFLEYGTRKNDFTCFTESNSLYAKSNKISLDYDKIEYNSSGVEFKYKDNLVLSPIPQQFSPIVIYKSTNGVYDDNPLTQVFFNDDEKYTLDTTETFNYEGFKTYYLQYSDVDIIHVKVNNYTINNFTIVGNIITINEEILYPEIIEIKYKLTNSYCVNYNYIDDTAIINFNTNNCDSFKVFYETNKDSNTKKLDSLSLNPIYNIMHGGYIYLTDKVFAPSKIIINAEDTFIYANSKDTMTVLVQVLDKNDNPIEGALINIVSALGKIRKESEKTDTNGIIKCKYTSYDTNAIDVIKAITSNGVKSEIKILNRRL